MNSMGSPAGHGFVVREAPSVRKRRGDPWKFAAASSRSVSTAKSLSDRAWLASSASATRSTSSVRA